VEWELSRKLELGIEAEPEVAAWDGSRGELRLEVEDGTEVAAWTEVEKNEQEQLRTEKR
jgi:hypothetical protein